MDFKLVKKVRVQIDGEDHAEGDLYVDQIFDGADPLGDALAFLESAIAELKGRLGKSE